MEISDVEIRHERDKASVVAEITGAEAYGDHGFLITIKGWASSEAGARAALRQAFEALRDQGGHLELALDGNYRLAEHLVRIPLDPGDMPSMPDAEVFFIQVRRVGEEATETAMAPLKRFELKRDKSDGWVLLDQKDVVVRSFASKAEAITGGALERAIGGTGTVRIHPRGRPVRGGAHLPPASATPGIIPDEFRGLQH